MKRLLKIALWLVAALALVLGGALLWLFQPWSGSLADLGELVPADAALVARVRLGPDALRELERHPLLARLAAAPEVRRLLGADGGGPGLRAFPEARRALEELERTRAQLPIDPVAAFFGREAAVALRHRAGRWEKLLLTRASGQGRAALRAALSPIAASHFPPEVRRDDSGSTEAAGFRVEGAGTVFARLVRDVLVVSDSAGLIDDAVRLAGSGGAGAWAAARGEPPAPGAIALTARLEGSPLVAEARAGLETGVAPDALPFVRDLAHLDGLVEARATIQASTDEARLALDLGWKPQGTTAVQDRFLFGPTGEFPGEAMDTAGFLPRESFLYAALRAHPVPLARTLFPLLNQDVKELVGAALQETRFKDIDGLFREIEPRLLDGFGATLGPVAVPADYVKPPVPATLLVLRAREGAWPFFEDTVIQHGDVLSFRHTAFSNLASFRLLKNTFAGDECAICSHGFAGGNELFVYTTAYQELVRVIQARTGEGDVPSWSREVERLFDREHGLERRASLFLAVDFPRMVPWLEDVLACALRDTWPPTDVGEAERKRIESRLSRAGQKPSDEQAGAEWRAWQDRWIRDAQEGVKGTWHPVIDAARIPGLVALTLSPDRSGQAPVLRLRAVLRLPPAP